MDYQGNSKKDKIDISAVPAKNVEKIVTGEVISKPKPLGRKFKDVFVSADVKGVLMYVFSDVLIPAARNMVVDASSKGIERLMYGESAGARRRYNSGGPRVTYNNPVNRPARNIQNAPTPSSRRHNRDDLILQTREEADLVLERMNDIIDAYEVASVADLNDLVGMPAAHTDNKWGWAYLGNADVRQIREGYLINLPPAEPI